MTAEENEAGLDRRAVLRRGAILGGALMWTTPAVQTIAGPAFAAGTPRCSTRLEGEFRDKYGNRQCVEVVYDPTESCCSCIATKTSAGKILPVAIALCEATYMCVEQSSSSC
jgi:hypothetical protein